MTNKNREVKYIPISGHEVNYLRVDVYYSLGGDNYYTGTPDARWYYLAVSPVFREDKGEYATESAVLGRGYKMFLKAVKRRSSKAMEDALLLAQEQEEHLVYRVATEHGYEFIKQ